MEEPRDHKTWVYLTATEAAFVKNFAETMGVTGSAVIRAILQRTIYEAQRNELGMFDLHPAVPGSAPRGANWGHTLDPPEGVAVAHTLDPAPTSANREYVECTWAYRSPCPVHSADWYKAMDRPLPAGSCGYVDISPIGDQS